ncbi:hypothetical protein HIM_03769 [Hirsutella minnesotensis 3608]|uniref:Uncharacterized protein n=1 Tax=Hirsutella minnesotensis 3608 TaxID=1043627 RepID=A0A0F8A2A5_9HYPO|nr:hypothetical protein HIM_03769 [Hirsutella minnesotensis 3608]
MSNIDLKAVELACMNDLGRARQDELFLSTKETHGPSFAPNRRNGTAHFAQKVKDKLYSSWSRFDPDEESEAIKGLAIEDARPWASKAPQPPNPPRTLASVGTKAPLGKAKKPKPSTAPIVKTVDVGRLGGVVPPGGSTVSRPTTRPPPGAVPATSGKAAAPVVPAASTSVRPRIVVRLPAASTIPKSPPRPQNRAEYILCQGDCELKTLFGQTTVPGSFAMKIDTDTNTAFLLLIFPGEAPKVHEIRDLHYPVLEDGFCKVTAGEREQTVRYSLRLASASLTQKFQYHLANLRRAALQQQKAPEKIAPPPDEPLITLTDDETPNQAGSTVTHPESTLSVHPPDKKGDAEKFSEILQRLIPDFADLNLSEDDVDDIEAIAVDSWINRDDYEDSGDFKENLVDLLKVLARFDRKKPEKAAGNQLGKPAGDEVHNTAFGPFQYSPEELTRLRRQAIPPAKKLDYVGITPEKVAQVEPRNLRQSNKSKTAREPPASPRRDEPKDCKERPKLVTPRPILSGWAIVPSHPDSGATYHSAGKFPAFGYEPMCLDSGPNTPRASSPATVEHGKSKVLATSKFRGLSSSRWA